MYAIFHSGGKQYKVREGDFVDIDLLSLDSGQVFDLEQVLLISSESGFVFGAPFVDGAKIKAEVVGTAKADKVVCYRYKRRKRYRRKVGHRQKYSRVKVLSISY